MAEVFVLGAGFSRAISNSMPLLNELGQELERRLDKRILPHDTRLPIADFENWLSFLAEDQPWLTEEEHLRHRATFLSASRLICEVIFEREIKARRSAPPDWLRALVARWHEDRAKVITFNYDNLVEAAYTDVVKVYGAGGSTDINYVTPVQLRTTPMMPIFARSGGVLGPSFVETFNLMKLHGSRSWMYSGRQTFYGETIYDACRVDGWSADDERPIKDWLIADKVPLVVPPTAGKTNFFNNETIRLEWRHAFNSLRDADRIWLVGYSFPETDLLVRFLLQHGYTDGTPVVVVNPGFDVKERVEHLLSKTATHVPIEYLDDAAKIAGLIPPQDPNPIAPIVR
ncbi:hypothetical protein AB0E59_36220 [Lentzea sp. NPDC034063]|uniref:hypothetical protein n=1 Tax=unclassified Lentzea TaxID=2643253 RepID=UPI0033E3E660